MHILLPTTITDAMLTAHSVAEPDTGETAWVPSGTYTVGQLRIRTQTHRVYECVADHTGIATVPELDPTRWADKAPTNRHAMLDLYAATLTRATGTLSFTVRPGWCNALFFQAFAGDTLEIVGREEPGGAIYLDKTGADAITLIEDVADEYEWCMTEPKTRRQYLLKDLVPYPDPEITVTITGTSTVGLGRFVAGDLMPLAVSGLGGTRKGARVELVPYSTIKVANDGTMQITKRGSSINMRATVEVPRADLDRAVFALQDLLATPVVAVGAADQPNADALSVFGLCRVSADWENALRGLIYLDVTGTP